MSLDRESRPPFGSLILPVYDAASYLPATLLEVRRWLTARPETWELVVVDDASRDDTPAILDAFAASCVADRVRVIRFDANHGKGFAVRAGLDRASGSHLVFTDADLAYPLTNVDRLLSRLANGAGAAIACRVLPDSTYTLSPRFFSYLFTRHLMGRAFNMVGRAVAVPRLLDTQAGLKAFRAEVVKPLLSRLRLDGFSFDVELLRALIDRGVRVDEVPVAFRYDSEPSTVHFAMDAMRMLRDLVAVRRRSAHGEFVAPDPERRLIVHADDYGLSAGVNRAIEQGLESGTLQSASILLAGERSPATLSYAASHPEFDFGVHLNLTHGRPALSPARVPSLVDGSGRFHRLRPFLTRFSLGRIALPEVAREWRAQIDAVRSSGIRISHLDSHQHVHLIPAIFRHVAARLATKERITLRAMDGPMSLSPPRAKDLALAIATKWSVGRRFRHLVRAHGTRMVVHDVESLDALREILRRARRGETVELVTHPGFADDELSKSGDGYTVGRDIERVLLATEDARSFVRLSGFVLSDFRA